MRIMCLCSQGGSLPVRSGWGRAFRHAGHDFRFWIPASKSAFDAFTEFEPDFFISTTQDLDRATYKNIVRRPHMKVALYACAWGDLVDNLDPERFPIDRASKQEISMVENLKKETGKPDFVFIHTTDTYLDGVLGGWTRLGVKTVGILNGCDCLMYLNARRREELICDVGYVGGHWKFKGRNLDRFLIPLCHPDSGLNVKIFGNTRWSIHQYLGYCSDEDARDLFKSATVCPNVSEPHSTEETLGYDVVERPYKTGLHSLVVSDYVPAATELFKNDEMVFCRTPDEFHDTIKHFVRYPDERLPHIERARNTILAKHTYHHRTAQFFNELGMSREADECLTKLKELLISTVPSN